MASIGCLLYCYRFPKNLQASRTKFGSKIRDLGYLPPLPSRIERFSFLSLPQIKIPSPFEGCKIISSNGIAEGIFPACELAGRLSRILSYHRAAATKRLPLSLSPFPSLLLVTRWTIILDPLRSYPSIPLELFLAGDSPGKLEYSRVTSFRDEENGG